MFNPGEVVRIKESAVRHLKDGTFKLTEILDAEGIEFHVIGQIRQDVMIARPPFPSRVVYNVNAVDLEYV